MSTRSKKKCMCPKRQRTIFKPPQDCKQLITIIKAISEDPAFSEYTEKASSKRSQASTISDANQTKRIQKEKSPTRMKRECELCIPMNPPMHMRLKIRGEHCRYDYESCASRPVKKPIKSKVYCCNYKEILEVDNVTGKKSVHYDNPFKPTCPLTLPLTPHSVKHTDSNTSIIRVPSPLLTGEAVIPQPASLTPSEHRPTVPSQRDFSLHHPHSGLYINVAEDFIPEGEASTAGRSRELKIKKKRKPKCLRSRLMQYKKQAQKRKLLKAKKKRCLGGAHSQASFGKPRSELSAHTQHEDYDDCGPDQIPSPQHVTIPMNLKRGTLKTHSLTVLSCPKGKLPRIHFGILTSSYNMNDAKYGSRTRGEQAMTMSVMAYCLAFHYHPKEWNTTLMNTILDCGDQWYLQCLDKQHDHSMVQGICEVLPFGKKHSLILNRKKMQIILGEPEVVGYTMTKDPLVYNLCKGLKMFFACNRAGIFLSRILKVVIWKDHVCYYIFDPAGRDSRANANCKDGKAALINVQDLESVTEVLLARSVIEDQKYVLAALKVLRMADENSQEDFCSDHEMTPQEQEMVGYNILSESCAIANGNLHLGDACFEDAKFRQALPIAIVAMCYGKISPPNTWNTVTVDKILRLGTKLYEDCTQPNVFIDLTIDNIPTDITVGPYKCEIIIYRERVRGQLFTNMECVLNMKTGLEEFFKKEYSSGILQFNNYTLAIWRQKEMYYIFDPYPCSPDGLKASTGQACVLMNLDSTSAADMFFSSWNYLPPTTQFVIHAFKVLKLKKQEFRAEILCPSDEDATGGAGRRRRRRSRGPRRRRSEPLVQCGGDQRPSHYALSAVSGDGGRTMASAPDRLATMQTDEEQLGDIMSLVDTILEDYVPPIPLRYKYPEPVPEEFRLINLDSPTVSVTQVVPPLPAPRDKTGEPPEPDPDPEPEPPPPPPPKAEGSEEEEEEEVEEEEEKEEEVESVEKELPPPPPSPEPEPELEIAPIQMYQEEEPMRQNVQRRVLLTADARYRYKLREIRKHPAPPLEEATLSLPPSQELLLPSNFKEIPDGSQIIRGTRAVYDEKIQDILPFVSIMAIVTSYKYKINTWSQGVVDFVLDTAHQVYQKKEKKFQFSPMHIIPKIVIGEQEYEATVQVGCEGATWQLERTLSRFLQRQDRGIITTAYYSCAVLRKCGLYYLLDGSPCNAVGLREPRPDGTAVLLRFNNLRALVHRFMYNKDGDRESQHFIISRIVVRRRVQPPRMRAPDTGGVPAQRLEYIPDAPTPSPVAPTRRLVGYHHMDGLCRIEGTLALPARTRSAGVKECHFVCLVAMLTLAIHPIDTWDRRLIDMVLEKGIEIFERACNLNVCEKRVIKRLVLEENLFDVNVKRVLVINENEDRSLEQYLEAVLPRLKYVIIRYPQCSMLIYQEGGKFHLFDPYVSPPTQVHEEGSDSTGSFEVDSSFSNQSLHSERVASWTVYNSLEALAKRIRQTVPVSVADDPTFYTYELTSVKKAPKRALFNYKLSPIFKPQSNPNARLRGKRRVLPVVDEKIDWVYIKKVPWTRVCPYNDLGYERNTSKTLWRDWDIEFPGDLYSLWGTVHPLSALFYVSNRGKQILAINVVAIAMTQYYQLSEWTSNVLDAIVMYGDQYHTQSVQSIQEINHELTLEELNASFHMYPHSFSVSFEKVIFSTMYSIHKDRFNLSKALSYFFENHACGILMCYRRNLAFGSLDDSYFMFDCQSFGPPVFAPQQGSSYILKCESLNRLIFCMTVTLNIRQHGVQFEIFSVNVNLGSERRESQRSSSKIKVSK